MMKQKRAVALITVLWILTIMGSITMVLSQRTNLSLKINRNGNQAFAAMMAAEAGVHHAIGILKSDALESVTDNFDETWYHSETAFLDAQIGDAYYRLVHPDLRTPNTVAYGMSDESGKININTASADALMQLDGMTEEIADAIIDWRDEDEEPGPLGAENEYYSSLPEPYAAKNALFDTIDELMLVKGVTLDLLFGEDFNINGVLDVSENDGNRTYPIDNGDGTLNLGWYPYITCYSYEMNVDETGTQRLNVNSASEDEMTERLSEALTEDEIESIIQARDQNNFQSIGDILDQNIDVEKFEQIADKVTISDETQLIGRININTAPETVLRTVLPDNPEVIQGIISYRQSSEGPFDSVGELLSVEGMTNDLFKNIVNQVGTKSSVFSVRSIGYTQSSNAQSGETQTGGAGGAYKEVIAILDRETDTPIRYWKVIK